MSTDFGLYMRAGRGPQAVLPACLYPPRDREQRDSLSAGSGAMHVGAIRRSTP